MDQNDGIRLDGKVALITGAAGEIGTATMQLMARRGARIVAVDRDAEALATALSKIPASAEAVTIVADVTEESEVASYVHEAVENAGTIDIFFNNAGIEGEIAPIVDYPLDAFRRVLDVNVIGVFLGMKYVLPVMLEKNAGSIINTASVAGLIGSPYIAVYSASKHAVIGLTKSAANEVANTNVRINCVCPGLIDSRMLSAIFEGRNPGQQAAAIAAKAIERIPAKRLGLTSEVASVVAFLASDEARYVHGASYTVDGGRLSS